MEWVIVAEGATSLTDKRVLVYLKDDNVYRQVYRSVGIDFDVETYINANFAAVWALGVPLSEGAWLTATQRKNDVLYGQVARAALGAFNQDGASLASLVNALHQTMTASQQAGAYNKFVAMVQAATAADKHNLSLIVAFLSLSGMVSDAKIDE